MSYKPNISGFVDFCSYHTNGEPIYFVDGHLYNGFDMLVSAHYRYNFLFASSLREVEKAIEKNWYMFDVEESNAFYYPNDNMFSGDNSQHHIPGYILRLKRKYGGQSDAELQRFWEKYKKNKKEINNYDVST